MSLLHDRAAVVTDAVSDIGFAIVATLIEEGAYVVGIVPRAASPRSEPLGARSYAFGYLLGTGLFTYLYQDTAPEEALVEQAARIATRTSKGIDILVNNDAILLAHCPINGEASNEQTRALQTQLPSVNRLSARLSPHMRSVHYGRIINIGSAISNRAAPHGSAQGTLLGLTQAQAAEYGPFGITANCLLLGGVDREGARGDNTEREFRRYVESQCPLRRMADVCEIASVVVFLASPLASYINGCALTVDGGLSLRSGGMLAAPPWQ